VVPAHQRIAALLSELRQTAVSFDHLIAQFRSEARPLSVLISFDNSRSPE